MSSRTEPVALQVFEMRSRCLLINLRLPRLVRRSHSPQQLTRLEEGSGESPGSQPAKPTPSIGIGDSSHDTLKKERRDVERGLYHHVDIPETVEEDKRYCSGRYY